ncbi:MAG TPA: acetylglutamate kinase [Actinomycetota bacterium]
MKDALEKSRILMEALPYIKRYHGKTIVVKYGGAAMEDPVLRESFADDIVLMRYVGLYPVIVHGGGPQVSAHVRALGREPVFVDGLRVTTAEDLEVVRMVLNGIVNADIVALINRHGSLAAGLSGEDGAMIRVRKKAGPVDLGFVGEVEQVSPVLVRDMLRDFIPVISTLGTDGRGQTYNVNADEVAAAIAEALGADKLVFLTNVEGILDRDGSVIAELAAGEVEALRADGTLSAGMLPKVDAALRAIKGGVPKATILDGRGEHAVLLEIFTDRGVGTMVTA